MYHEYSYESALSRQEAVHWRIEDIIGGSRTLDFDRPFMPETLARTAGFTWMTPAERRTLNQIRGHEYLSVFGLVEEFILPFVLDHVRPHLRGDDARVRAMLNFAEEEAKHIELFKRFASAFREGFGTDCAVIGPPEAIAAEVLKHDPLAVALAILHIEWMTQGHYLDSVKGDDDLDPQFRSLLRHHWMEEAQHAKLDTLMVEALAEDRSVAEIDAAVAEYLEIGAFLDAGLMQQVSLNIDAFERATGRTLDPAEREEVETVQQQAVRWTYLVSGMTHQKFLETVGRLSPGALFTVEETAAVFC